MEREIIIVGAGPAGATAAMILAQAGRDVLLIDRQDFPRDKICGDAVPAGVIQLMQRYGMAEKIAAAVDRGHLYPINQLRLVSPKGYRLDANFPHEREVGVEAFISPRVHFDALLHEHAVDSGAEFRVGQVKGALMENGKVRGVSVQFNGHVEEVRSKCVIAADGVSSVIARAVRPEKHALKHSAVAIRAYIEDIEELPNMVEFYMYNEILPGYAWIFPTGKGAANIGLGVRSDKYKAEKTDLKLMLRQFLDMPAIKGRLKNGGVLSGVRSWPLSFGSQKIQHAYDGVLLTGDAGGFINPLTGGGIHNAMISARISADIILDAFAKNDFSQQSLSIYDKRVHDEMWGNMIKSYRFQHYMGKYPFLMDMVVRYAGANSAFAQTFLTKL